MSTSARALEGIPVAGLVAVSQTALGCGVGLLIAGKLRESVQRTTAIVMFSLGLLTTVPLALGYFAKAMNRPESARQMKRRLESIRDDAGFSEDADVF
jgi:hypothetical protein